MNLYDVTIPVFIKALKGLDAWLGKAMAHADTRKFNVDVLAAARLAPDQFELAKQVQSACDTAKYAAAKLTGTAPPAHPDTEKTVNELRARIKTCTDYLAGFKREDFANAETVKCEHSWMGGKHVKGLPYVHEYALPNFYFHLVHAYAILRHNGVELGKFDYLTSLPFES